MPCGGGGEHKIDIPKGTIMSLDDDDSIESAVYSYVLKEAEKKAGKICADEGECAKGKCRVTMDLLNVLAPKGFYRILDYTVDDDNELEFLVSIEIRALTAIVKCRCV
jgi:hypothetical protein